MIGDQQSRPVGQTSSHGDYSQKLYRHMSEVKCFTCGEMGRDTNYHRDGAFSAPPIPASRAAGARQSQAPIPVIF